jgi:hypothetical protein
MSILNEKVLIFALKFLNNWDKIKENSVNNCDLLKVIVSGRDCHWFFALRPKQKLAMPLIDSMKGGNVKWWHQGTAKLFTDTNF